MSSPDRQAARRCGFQDALDGSEDRPRLLAIVGPTAVGKTDLALRIAAHADVEIVSADSRQVYRHMNIGSAKPTPAQLSAVKHHLVDIIEPDGEFNLGQFLYLSKNAILNANTDGRCPLLVGGTGQYVMARLENWNVPAIPPNPQLRAELESQLDSHGADSLVERLRNMDPDAAARVEVSNPRRVIRAIEVAAAAGPNKGAPTRLSPWFESAVIGVGMDRSALYQRADERVDRMMAAGFLDEVMRLLDMGYDPALSSMSGIGYHELAEHLLEGTDLPDAIQRTKFRTHRFIRQQSNWFKRDDPRIRWFEPSQMEAAVDYALKWNGSRR